jgi:hypothetical protein
MIDTKPQQNYYKPKNKKEREAREMVWSRYRIMRDDQKRKEAEEEWDLGDKMFMQWQEPREDGDWRAHVTLPDGFAAVQTHMQETIERRSRPVLKPVEVSDNALMMFGNAVFNHSMDVTGYDYQDYLAKQTAAIRGTAFVMENYRLEKREIQDLTGVDEDGKLKYEKKTVTDVDDTYTEWVDNEFIFLDPGASDQNLMRDMVHREIISWDELQRVYSLQPEFMNIDKVPKAGLVDDRVRYFERPKDVEDDEVEVLHYYNRATDAYYVLANNVLIRMTPLPFKHKELPVSVHTHYNIPGRIYGMGIPKVIYSLTEERKSLRNLFLDRQHLQGDKMFLVNDLVDLDEEDARSRPHGLIPVNTNGLRLDQVIQPVEYGDTPISYYRAEEMLLEDIRRAHGIDDRLQGNNTGGTATEAAILKEASQRRINLVNSLAEMNTIVRIGRLKWSNIQFFYPAGRTKRLMATNDENEAKEVRTVRVEGRQFSVVKDSGTGKNRLQVNDIDGDSSFKLTKKFASYMGGNWDVTMGAEGKGVLSKPLKQAKITEMFNMLALNPQLMASIDPTKSVKRYIEINEEDPRAWMRDGADKTAEDWQRLAMHENIVMANGMMLAPTQGATEEHTAVHLDFMNSKEYDDLIAQNPGMAEIFESHAFGENDNNPNTQNVSDAGIEGDDGSRAGGGVGGGATGAGVDVAPVDLTPSTIGGEDQRDAQQESVA